MNVNWIKIDLNYVKPGKIFIYPMFSKYGEKILDERTPLTENKINEIKSKYGNCIYYKRSAVAPADDSKIINRAIELSREIMDEIMKTEKLSASTYRKTEKMIEDIISELNISGIVALDFLKRMKSHEEYIYNHSVNVGVMSAFFSGKIGKFTPEEIKQISLGAFLFDIGLIKLDRELLRKAGKFEITDHMKMKRHPQLGYEVLKSIPGVDPIVLQTVLFHHERYNNNGYYNLPFENLPVPPKIVSLCDTYDALTTKRPFREALAPQDALKKITNLMNNEFSYNLVSSFVNILGPVLNHSQSFYSKMDFCELTSHEIAVIKETGEHDLLKPIVWIICKFDKVGRHISVKFYNRAVEVDLRNDPDRRISRFLTNKNQIEVIKSEMIKKKMFL